MLELAPATGRRGAALARLLVEAELVVLHVGGLREAFAESVEA